MAEGKQKRVTDFFSGGSKKRPGTMIFDENSREGEEPKKRRVSKELEGQRALDAGQAKIGMQRCNKCEMVYSVDVEADRVEHERHCSGEEGREGLAVRRRVVEGWVRSCLGVAPGSDRYPLTGACTVVLEVTAECEQRSLRSRVEEVIETHVNPSLGFSEEGRSPWESRLSAVYGDSAPSSQASTVSQADSQGSTVSSRGSGRRKAYVAILRNDKGVSSIAGVVLVEAISRAIDVDAQKMVRADRLVGVNRLWVEEGARGRGVARRMVEEARTRFYGMPTPRSRVVFSEPTKEGEAFARRYTSECTRGGKEGGRLLVYNLGDGGKWKEEWRKMREEARRSRSQRITVGEEEKGEKEVDQESTVDNDDGSRSPPSEQL